jgi:hypothetical protein
MITERRQIIFSNNALKEAVLLFRTAHPDLVPHGQLHRVWVAADPEVGVYAQFEQLGARRHNELRLGRREVAACVILYCRKHKIPLPRTADKFLEVEGGCVSLVITKQFDPAA